MEERKLDPWGSKEITDYEHIFAEFGLKKFPSDWSKEMDHILFRRRLVVAHRDFQKIIQKIQDKEPFINMTGIASSGPMHFGHKVGIGLFKFFKSVGAKNYFAVNDLDAYCSRPDMKISSLQTAKEWAVKNVADALALGLDKKDIYVTSNYKQRYYVFGYELSKKITQNMFKAIYGHVDMGKVAAVLLQLADILHPQLKEFEGCMPSVTGIGLDQDPHARLTRDIARKLMYSLELPSFIYFKHQSGLLEGSKMSASQPNTAIFLNDKPSDAVKKIKKAVTGGRETVEKQKKLGGDPDVCKVHEMQKFHYPDDEEVKRIYKECKEGNWLCGECKKLTSDFVKDFLEKHQKKVAKFMPVAKKIVNSK